MYRIKWNESTNRRRWYLCMQNSSWYDKWERGSWKKSIEKCTQRDDWPNQKEAIDKDKNSCERVRFLDQ